MTSPDVLEQVVSDLLEEYSQNEADHDRHPSDEGFIQWLGWRLHTAHAQLSRITDADDDVFTTLESTVEHVVRSYRAITTAEEQAADEISRLRGELNEIGNLAYRAAGNRDALTDALHAIHTRARAAARKGLTSSD
jgi:hypothetical protein